MSFVFYVIRHNKKRISAISFEDSIKRLSEKAVTKKKKKTT